MQVSIGDLTVGNNHFTGSATHLQIIRHLHPSNPQLTPANFQIQYSYYPYLAITKAYDNCITRTIAIDKFYKIFSEKKFVQWN